MSASISIVSAPKPFEGHIDLIQRNALVSWLELVPQPEVILVGDDRGIAEICKEFDIRHIPAIARNEFGTPLMSDIFHKIRHEATNPIACYVNADIIFFNDLVDEVAKLRLPRFLLVGERTDLDVTEALERGAWVATLEHEARRAGRRHGPTGLDYFVFPRDLWVDDLPPFALGRVAWDNYVIYRALKDRIPVVDATERVMAVHQNHDYGHVSGGREAVRSGPEARKNIQLAGDPYMWLDIRDADWVLTPDGVERARDSAHLRRRLVTMPTLHPGLAPMFKGISRLRQRLQRGRGKS